MQKLFLLAILAAAFQSNSCKKIILGEGTYRVTGQVVDKFTGEPVPEAHVELLASSGPGSAWGVVETFPTDNEGHFDFKFQEDPDLIFDIRPAYYEMYDNYDSQKAVGQLMKNKNHKLELHPLGWVKVNFINEPPLDTLNSVAINGINAKVYSHPLTWKDTFLIGWNRCCEDATIYWEMVKKSQIEKGSKTFNLNPHDTLIIDLIY